MALSAMLFVSTDVVIACDRVVNDSEECCLQEDWIGLRRLDEAGKVVKVDCPGAHMQFSLEWLTDHIILSYLATPEQ